MKILDKLTLLSDSIVTMVDHDAKANFNSFSKDLIQRKLVSKEYVRLTPSLKTN